jgi:hypothetical protein
MKITADITWTTNDYNPPSKMEVEITQEIVDAIKVSREFMEKNPVINKTNVSAYACLKYEEDEDNGDRVDVTGLAIYRSGGIYVEATSKWSSETQYEAELDYKEIKEHFALKAVIDKV